MKKVEKEYTRIEKEVYYEAWDGSRFNTEADCNQYEDNARGVVGKRVQEFKVDDINSQRLYDPLVWTSEEEDVEIFLPRNAKDIDDLNMYLNFYYKDVKVLKEDCIGKYMFVEFNYDKDWCQVRSMEELVTLFTEHLEKLVKKEEEKSE